MTQDAKRPPLEFERSYEAPVEDLWALWTTKEGFESWWGPEGFRVEVHKIEPRVGGELFYEMIAAGAEQVAQMKQAGQPLSHETRGTFVEITPHRRLAIRHVIDFLPGVEPYPNDMVVEFVAAGSSVRMIIRVDRHPNEEMTRMASMGLESQLAKVPGALAARRK